MISKIKMLLCVLMVMCSTASYGQFLGLSGVIESTIPKVATVLVHAGGGTGTVISTTPGHTWYITCAHVAEDAKNGELTIVPGGTFEKHKGKVVRQDKAADLAMVDVAEDMGIKPMRLASSPPNRCDNVFAVGSPWGVPDCVAYGRVSDASLKQRSEGSPLTELVNVSVGPGMSGGPMCNEAGELVGVIRSQFKSTNFTSIIPASSVRTFMKW